jgi:hypothetical protein
MIDEAEGIDEETAKALIAKNIEMLRELGLKQEQPAQLQSDRAQMGPGGSEADRNGRSGQRGNQGNFGGDKAGDVVPGGAQE